MNFRALGSKLLRLGLALGVVVVLVGAGILLVQRKQAELRESPEYGQRPRPVSVAKSTEGHFHEAA